MSNQRGGLKKLLALIMLIAVSFACSQSSESTRVIFLDRMHQLAQAPALTLELIRDTLEVDFEKDAEASHDMITFFIGKPRPGSPFKSLIKLVDCRVPTKENATLLEPFLVVELQHTGGEPPADADRRTTRLLSSDLVARFGEPDSFQPALPENLKSSGSYIYKVGSRSLWMSQSRQAPEEVLEISIHALEEVH